MTVLIRRPYSGKTDLKAIAELVNTCETVGQLDKDTSVAHLPLQLDEPSFDKARDLRLWEDDTGTLMGFGQISMPEAKEEIDGYLYFYVHPKAHEDHLETDIIRWSERRMLEVTKERGLPAKLRSSSRDDITERIAVLEQHQFTVDRHFLTMTCRLDRAIPAPQLPAGFTLRPLAGDREMQAWVECFNQSFIDHWNHHDMTVTTLKHWLSDPHYMADLNLIALAPDGTLAAFCYAGISPEENSENGGNEGWIYWLGTGRSFRKLGLGKALLLAAMHQLKAAGVSTVKLAVDADSMTGARRLYDSVGFEPAQTWLSYVKPV
ncbi:GNAT family N-acetyltransferase [Microcoleus sp. FACHB-68]|uniref:GNAT family N-acetyltransferase n=1 Tax=Microcoleus sp. FACHB-68 TaxID=2692826 RepID=UPI00168298AF|nr:GNAT family N-acetyltransferase [Microcoleus sp. FACHB-68]MBD1939273.1 GNAT family N-acetyltransferase [Microcoleus sp. FACHB-68]